MPGDAGQIKRNIPDKTMINLCHVINLNQWTAKNKITTVKPWDSREKEDLDGIIYTRVQQFLEWRKESQDIEIRLEALLHAR